MSARRALPLGVLVAAGLLVAGCGGSSSSKPGADHAGTQDATTTQSSTPTSAAGGSSNLQLRADAGGQLAFDKTSLQAKAGRVTITLKNPAPLSHNIAIDGVSRQGDVVSQGGTSKLTATLKGGTYTFYCAVPGHRQAGMQGTLTVK